VQVDAIKPTLKAPGTKLLKLVCDELLSNFTFNFKLRCYNLLLRMLTFDARRRATPAEILVGRRRLTLWNPR
jgi:hypothetical protein